MHNRESRASSDAYTPLPARRVARQDHPASDATPLARGGARPRSSPVFHQDQQGRSHPTSRPQSYPNVELMVNRQQALDALNGKRTPEPSVPLPTYASPSPRHRPAFDDAFPPNHSGLDFERNQPRSQQQAPLSTRVHAYLSQMAQEPVLSSPPSTPGSSRRNSFSGLSDKEFGYGSHEYDNEPEHDMFIRAMELNRDVDGREFSAADVDVQAYSEQALNSEKPTFFEDLQFGENRDHGKHLSYKERRKKGKHRIMYNKDSKFQVVNQSLNSFMNFRLRRRQPAPIYYHIGTRTDCLWLSIPSYRAPVSVSRCHLRTPSSVRPYCWLRSNLLWESRDPHE